MALSADLARPFETGPINTLPVKASATIYRGSAVGLSSGYARALVAGDAFQGFADAQVVEATAANGGAYVNVITKGLVEATITSVAVTDVGSAVYMSADGTFTLTKGSNSFVGNVYRYVAANTCIVAFLAQGLPAGELAAGATLASANLLVGNGSNVAVACAVTGDITITNAGVTAIGANKVLSAMISAGQILSGHIASGAVIAAKIGTAAVLSGHISAATITFDKFSESCLSEIISAVTSAGA